MKSLRGHRPSRVVHSTLPTFERRQSRLPFQGISDLGLMSRDKIWMEVKGARNVEVS